MICAEFHCGTGKLKEQTNTDRVVLEVNIWLGATK